MDNRSEGAKTRVGMGPPEFMLALSALCISPLMVVFLVADIGLLEIVFWFVPSLLMFALSLAYLGETAPRGLMKSFRTQTLGRHGKALVGYLMALAAFMAVFALTLVGLGFVSFMLFVYFIPFNAVGVLLVTVAARNNDSPKVSKLRLNLAIVQLIFALPWPFALMYSII